MSGAGKTVVGTASGLIIVADSTRGGKRISALLNGLFSAATSASFRPLRRDGRFLFPAGQVLSNDRPAGLL